jgi:hypothetical protein
MTRILCEGKGLHILRWDGDAPVLGMANLTHPSTDTRAGDAPRI